MEYNGERTLEDLSKFIETNGEYGRAEEVRYRIAFELQKESNANMLNIRTRDTINYLFKSYYNSFFYEFDET